MSTPTGKGLLLHSDHQFKCKSLPETSTQTHPEIVFYQLSGHPLGQSGGHVKLTITATLEFSYLPFFLFKLCFSWGQCTKFPV